TTPTAPAGKSSARSTASLRRTMTQRSAQNIGCSGSIPSRTPSSWARGTSSPTASAIMRRARPRSRRPGHQPPGDQDQRVGPQGGGLLDGGPVVGHRGAARTGVGVSEEPAPAQAGDMHPGPAHGGGGLGESQFGHPVPPQPDGPDLVPQAQVEGLRQGQRLDGGLVQRQAADRDQRLLLPMLPVLPVP